MIDNDLRTRILEAFSPLVESSKHREDDCRQNVSPEARGGYSDPLQRAIAVLEELRAPAMLFASQGFTGPPVWTEQQCKDAAIVVGGTEDDGVEFFLQYAGVGYKRGSGVQMIDLNLEMRRWVVRRAEIMEAIDLAPPRKTCTGPTARQLDIEARGG